MNIGEFYTKNQECRVEGTRSKVLKNIPWARVSLIASVGITGLFSGTAETVTGALPFGIAAVSCFAQKGSLNIYFIPFVLIGMLPGVINGGLLWGDFFAALLSGILIIFLSKKRGSCPVELRCMLSGLMIIICNFAYFTLADMLYRFDVYDILFEVIAAAAYTYIFSFAIRCISIDLKSYGTQWKRLSAIYIVIAVSMCGAINIAFGMGTNYKASSVAMLGIISLMVMIGGYYSGPQNACVAGAGICLVLMCCGVWGTNIFPIVTVTAMVSGVAAHLDRIRAAIYISASAIMTIYITCGETQNESLLPMIASILAAATLFVLILGILPVEIEGIFSDSDNFARTMRQEQREIHIKKASISKQISGYKTCFENLVRLCRAEGKMGEPVADAFAGISETLETLKIFNEETYINQNRSNNYDVEEGFAGYSGSCQVSGDSFLVKNLGNGRVLYALSDGMGKGEQADRESRFAVEAVANLIGSGASPHQAIKTLNSILNAGGNPETFVTMDLCILDKRNGILRMYKAGACPTFIKRRGQRGIEYRFIGANLIESQKRDRVETIDAPAPPIGIIDSVNVGIAEVKLKKGDQILMVSDGIIDSLKKTAIEANRRERKKDPYSSGGEIWLRETFSSISSNTPQTVADIIMSRTIENYGVRERDDLTAIVLYVK